MPTNPPLTILLADDLHLFRQGLCYLLEHEDSITVAGEASNGEEAFQLVGALKPDVVVTDIQMPVMDGIALTREMRQTFPDIPVIALTQFKEDHLIADMMEAGARGYLLKSSDKEHLLDALKAVHAGGWYYCESTSERLLKLLAGRRIEGLSVPKHIRFNAKEEAIIRLICEEKSTREIAEQVFLSEKTIENYRYKIFEKMGVKNMAGMAVYAMRCGIYRPE